MVKLTYLRILFSFASTLDLEIHQMDVHVDFLNGTLHEEIFMQQPKGYIQKGFENKVCWILHILYGFKQSPHVWYEWMDSFILGISFTKNQIDTNVRQTSVTFLFIGLYVDDTILMNNHLT